MITVRFGQPAFQCHSLSSLNLVVDSTIKIIYFHNISPKLLSVLKIEK